MATCPECHGTGQVQRGYQPCRACGGTGVRNGVRCENCKGTGISNNARYVTCPRCYGTGTVADPYSPRPRAPSSSKAHKSPAPNNTGSGQRQKWDSSNTIAFFVFYIAGLAYLYFFQGVSDSAIWFYPLVPALFAAAYWKALVALLVLGGIILVISMTQGGAG